MRKVLIVGGRGFLGAHLARELLGEGYEVHTLGRSPVGGDINLANLHHHQGDAKKSAEFLARLSPIQMIFYLAHEGWPGFPWENEKDTEERCLQPLRCFLDSITPTIEGLPRTVYVSSGGAIYGHQGSLPIPEQTTLQPVSQYGRIKFKAEQLGLELWRTRGLFFLAVRPGNAYGPGQIPGRGAGFPAAAIQAIHSRVEIPIFGFPGTVRDYLHVRDVVRGIRLLGENGLAGEAYNLGTGIGTNNAEIVEILRPWAEAENLSVRVRKLEGRECDVQSVVLDSGKAFAVCRWRAEIGLSDGLWNLWQNSSAISGRRPS